MKPIPLAKPELGTRKGFFCPGARGGLHGFRISENLPSRSPSFSCSSACHSDVILSRTVQTHHTWLAVWKHARTSARYAENTQLSKDLNLTCSEDTVFSWLYLTARQVEKSTHLEIKHVLFYLEINSSFLSESHERTMN